MSTLDKLTVRALLRIVQSPDERFRGGRLLQTFSDDYPNRPQSGGFPSPQGWATLPLLTIHRFPPTPVTVPCAKVVRSTRGVRQDTVCP